MKLRQELKRYSVEWIDSDGLIRICDDYDGLNKTEVITKITEDIEYLESNPNAIKTITRIS